METAVLSSSEWFGYWLIGGTFAHELIFSRLICVQPSSIPATPVIQQNGIHDSTELDILREQIKSRDTKIVELEKEAALLRDEKDMLTLEVIGELCHLPWVF